MAARALWKARVLLGSNRIPVKLYAATQDRKVHFRLLHAADLAPLGQQMVDPQREQVVPKEQQQHGLQVEEGVLVLLSEQERKALHPAPSREITVKQVVARAGLDLRWFDRPYHLGPDGDDESYAALAQLLEERDQVGIAHWVMRGKRYRGALGARNGYLVLETLHHAEQLVPLERVRPAAQRAPDARELALAEQLVAMLEDRFDPAEYRDDYRERLLRLIEAKARGQVIPLAERRPRESSGELLDALEASLRGQKRPGRQRASHGG